MVRSILIIGAIILGAASVQAQDTLEVQGTAPDLYVTHTVKKGETFYSLSRAYSVPPKEIAAQNNLSFEGGLQLGQSVKIPLTQGNFLQGSDAGGHPVYHKVSEKETLYRISVNYNKVPLDNIRHWNNFTGDGVKKDGYLIVGYLKGSSSGAAAPPVSHPAPATPPPAAETTTVVKKETPPASVTPAPPVITPAPPVQTNTEPAKETVKKETPAPPATTNSNAKKEQAPPPAANPPAASSSSGASFESIYEQQTAGKKVTTEKGPGSWFKSNAGAGKYYALHNTASRGTIIKVTNPLNGKSIYAKVLEAIPQMKQNAGLIIKLSDSAIEALGTNETKFYCELSYEN